MAFRRAAMLWAGMLNPSGHDSGPEKQPIEPNSMRWFIVPSSPVDPINLFIIS